MPMIRCTQKLGKEMGGKLESREEVSTFDWHANLLWIQRRKHVMFCSDVSRLSCLSPAVSRREIRDLDQLFRASLFDAMRFEGFADSVIDRVVAAHEPMSFAKTNSRSVLGTLTDNALHVSVFVEDAGSLAEVGLPTMHYHLNHMPLSPIRWKYAVEVFGEDIVNAVVDVIVAPGREPS